MRCIPLTQSQIALVDDEDFERLNSFKWRVLHNHSGSFYAMCHIGNKNAYMHRMILKACRGQFVDHINHNGLDNRRKNLRIVSGTQNQMNGRRHTNNRSSGYKGTYWDKSHKRWYSNFRNTHIGNYDSEIMAARAYDSAAYAFDPVHCLLNFPKPKL
jgi:AP2 domain/HNH endonuclease